MNTTIEWLKEANLKIAGVLLVAFAFALAEPGCLYSSVGKTSNEEFLKLCESGEATKVEEAIMNGADVNAKDNRGRTALMLSARGGNMQVAESLLKHGEISTLRGIPALRIIKASGFPA